MTVVVVVRRGLTITREQDEQPTKKAQKGEDAYPVPYVGALVRTARATFHMNIEEALKGAGKIRGEMLGDYLPGTAMAASASHGSPRRSPANGHLPLFLLLWCTRRRPFAKVVLPRTRAHTHLDRAIRRIM